MPFYTDNNVEMMMVLNSFGPRFDPLSIPSYDDWVANNTFNPFGPEPSSPVSHPNYGIPPNFQTRGGLRIEGGVDVISRVDRGYGSSEDVKHNFPQERSRFAFAQKRIARTTDASTNQTLAAHVRQSPIGRSQTPIPIKTTRAVVPRVVGPRPLQRAFHIKKEPTLSVPRARHPLPTWLTHFEDYEEELLAEFCPPSEDPSPSTSTFPATGQVEHHSDHVLECSPLNIAPVLGFTDLDSDSDSDSDSDYTDIDIEAGDWSPEEDEDSDEEDKDYDPFEFDVSSNFGSDYVTLGSESSAPTSYRVDTFDWPAPYQGQVADGEGYSRPTAVAPLEFPPWGSSSLPSSGLHVPPDFLPWSAFTNPFTGTPITASPPEPSVAPVSAHDTTDGVAEVDADRFLAEMEEGLRFGSGLSPELTLSSSEGNAKEWYDRFDLTGYTFPLPPRQPQSPNAAAGFEAPPPVYATTVPLPNIGEGEDVELDAIVISPRSPQFGWR